MSKPSNFITEINTALAPKLKKDLEDQGFELSQPTYTIFQAKKKGVSCTLYQSGKLMVQGKEKDDFISYYLEPEILGNVSYTYPETAVDMNPHIGVDEAGKGDVFGPLCVAALYADEKMISDLIKMGIRDSKRLNDSTIIKLADKIKKECPHSIIQIFPKRYNELYDQFKNLNHLLAWGHATAIEELLKKTDCRTVIIDQFANEHVVENALKRKSLEVELFQRHRGEEDIVVAGASILARAAFVQGIEKLGSQFNLTLPKGASSLVIKAGQQFVQKHGEAPLNEVAKLHFKTIKDFT
ncbi:MAG: ribonuclease HIII [Chlamydiales bacterium]|nr:ribonuclease HIII [Chlamydiia bacterium]MCP5504503.1 ribonuclease HIII [Chlamydiales bacterium]